MNEESYNLAEIWPFPVNAIGGRTGFNARMGLSRFGDLNVGDGPLDEHLTRKRTDMDEESFKGLVCASDELNDGLLRDAKRVQVMGSELGEDIRDGRTLTVSEPSSGKNVERKTSEAPEPPKQDYIHVRARRGQATDSHSLAERARREKISERMKILQDLVPGCNKVIGKASVLDEIINYIQSLQRQVEFLSMKLEAVNARLTPGIDVFSAKDFGQVSYDPTGMQFGSQVARDYNRGPSPEWLHIGGFERT